MTSPTPPTSPTPGVSPATPAPTGAAVPTVSACAYGPDARRLLADRIGQAKQEDPLNPVTIVVPTNSVGVSARRALAAGTLAGGGPRNLRGGGLPTGQPVGIAGLTLLTVYRLAELLGAPRLAGAGRRPVSTPIVAAAVRTALRTEPGRFAPVAEHPATETALVAAYHELSELDDVALDALAATGQRAAAVVSIRRRARALLAPAWYEEADLMAAATAAVRAGTAILGDVGVVLIYLPERLSGPAAGLLSALTAVTPTEVIVGRTGVHDADADVDRALGRLGVSAPAIPLDPPTATAIESVSDPEEEVRSAVQRVVDAARQGVPAERIAVLYPSRDPYARLLAEQFAAAGIPTNGEAAQPLAERVAGRWLRDVLALADGEVTRAGVLALVTGASLRDRRGRPLPTAAWERLSRDAGVVRGVGQFTDRLRSLAAELRRQADREERGPEGDEPRADRLRRDAARASALAAFVGELGEALDAARRLTDWAGLADWARRMFERHLGGPSAREHWPDVEREGAERVLATLERLASLTAVEPVTDLVTFRRTLELALADDRGRSGVLGEGVLVGGLASALGLDLDVVVVLGLAEGTLPSSPQEDALLLDTEREVTGGALRRAADHTGTQRRHLLAALAGAQRDRVLIVPRGDLRRTVEREPSRWALDSAEVRTGGERALPTGVSWHTEIASFAHRLAQETFPATEQLYRLGALARHEGALDDVPLVRSDQVLARGVELVTARAAAGCSRFDGAIGPGLVPVPGVQGPPVSATRLERWLTCPFHYLITDVLGIRPVESPEELLAIDPRERGELIHGVLEQWLAARLEQPPSPTTPWSAADRSQLRTLAEDACEDAEARGVTGHPLVWRRDRRRIIADLVGFADADDDVRRGRGRIPHDVETPFGEDPTTPVVLTVNGEAVRLTGRIDRVDRAGAGTVVTDYKTGRAGSFTKLSSETPLGPERTRLQLLTYGVALGAPTQPVEATYWFVTRTEAYREVHLTVDAAAVTALTAAVAVAIDGIRGGLFPQRPRNPRERAGLPCSSCEPNGQRSAVAWRRWQTVRAAPQLAAYVAHLDGADETGAA